MSDQQSTQSLHSPSDMGSATPTQAGADGSTLRAATTTASATRTTMNGATATAAEATMGAMPAAKHRSDVLLEVKSLVKYFPVRGGLLQRIVAWVKAVDDVTFFVREGETLGLVGESGCGKTTVGRTLLNLIPATRGQVLFDGKDILAGPKPSRPPLVALLGGLIVAAAAVLLACFVIMFFSVPTVSAILGIDESALNSFSAGFAVFFGLFGALLLSTGLAIISLKPWARMFTVFLSVVGVLLGIWAFLGGSVNQSTIAWLAISVLALAVLFIPSVTQAFYVRSHYFKNVRKDMQIIFQDPFSSLDPRVPIGESIGEGLMIQGVPRAERQQRVNEVLSHVGLLPEHAKRFPHEFSGGQRQRIGIARALVLRPKFIVCDEPVSALDVSIQSQVLNILKDLQREYGLTYLFIAHNLSVVEHISDRVGVMYLGKMAELTTREALFENPQHPYTHALLSAIPIPDPKIRRERIILKGDVPSPLNPPSGCRFHTRCWLAQDVCKQQIPEWRNIAPPGQVEHFVACHFAPFTKMPLPGEAGTTLGKDETMVVKK